MGYENKYNQPKKYVVHALQSLTKDQRTYSILRDFQRRIDSLNSCSSLKSALKKCAFNVTSDQNMDQQIIFLFEFKTLLILLGQKKDGYFQNLYDITQDLYIIAIDASLKEDKKRQIMIPRPNSI